jgi:hypothetical protein
MRPFLSPSAPWTEDREAFLSRAGEELRDSRDITSAMESLSGGLWWFRQQDDPGQWRDWVQSRALAHPLREILHSDPFTRRAFAKPRGFAGDAGLIDLIYFDQGWANLRECSEIGRRLFWRNRNAPAPRAVRERRDYFASLIDRTALRRDGARILVIACGHLREGLLSSAVQMGSLGELVAFDQDDEALAIVRATLGASATCRKGSVRSIVTGNLSDERFDLVYAAGLYDYLQRPLAARLTARLFDLLNREGQLVIANFTRDVADVGYMESYMDWHLIYRSLDELVELAIEVPEAARRSASVFQLAHPDIAYLQLARD